MKIRFFGFCRCATKDDLLATENRIKELILKVAGESDRAKIQALIDELAAHRASLKEAINKNK